MPTCPKCGALVEADLLFCRACGATVTQAQAAAVVPPPNPATTPVTLPPLHPGPSFAAPPFAAPPPEWIPPRLEGRAKHCVECNTLISWAAVYCPACGKAQPEAGGAVAVAEPPR
jgi:RNA polymerase subunit RPABC4/transcription elongation factor Spt4